MRYDVRFAPHDMGAPETEGRTVVVVDVLRATSTMAVALAHGASAVVPVSSVEDARQTRERLGPGEVLLCGERGGLRIDGFDLGNSPAEFSPERIGGATLVMTTTNGTRALLAAAGAERCLAGSFLNLGAIASAVAATDLPVTVLCSGRERKFAMEDAVLAGAVGLRLRDLGVGPREGNDAGLAAMALAQRFLPDPERLFRYTAAGRALMGVGLEEDLGFCARTDAFPVVPELRDGRVTLAG